ncbi:MAG: alpha/beta hydrolase [Candidatus Eremiobacteraeota bacterium]|nr:alpha/beta hydrolase [Candidatus Eremiobacteraeota bacterium]
MTAERSTLSQSVTVEGPQGAPGLLLVHGIHLGRYSWQPHLAILRRDFRVATIDLPRHGTMYDVPFTKQQVNAQLRYVVEEILGAPPLLVGYSLGGYCITQFAGAFPALTNGLLLAGCSLDPTHWREGAYGALVGVGEQIPRPIFDSFSSMFFRMTLRADLAEAIISNPFNPRAFSETHALLRGQRFSAMLNSYPHPVLIVNGEYDFVFRPQERRFIKEARAEHRIVKGSDHVFPLRRPEEFSAIIADFSAGVITRAAQASA